MIGKLTLAFILGVLVFILTLAVVFLLLPIILASSLAVLGVFFITGAVIVVWVILYTIVIISIGIYYLSKPMETKKSGNYNLKKSGKDN